MMTRRRTTSPTTLDRFRRSRFLASATLVATLLSIIGPTIPRTALAQSASGGTNPGNPGASLGPSNTGVQQGQTALSIPETGPAASLLANWSVDSSTGAFSASVPFVMPQARGAVQPNLALVYSSSGGPGAGGLGWSLNLPSIERHNLYGSPQYVTDPAPGDPITPATQDRFTFGGQPLIPICTASNGAACRPIGQNGSVVETMPTWATGGWTYYRLEAEMGSNLRFFWSPNHQTWVVQEPSGATMELGVPQNNLEDTGGIDVVPSAALPAGAACYTGTSCYPAWSCNTAAVCTPPATPYVYRWNLVRHYDAQRIPGTSVPTNVIEYIWNKLTSGSVTLPISDLTDIYDTPHVGDSAPAPSSFAHHTHLSYKAFGSPPSTRVERAFHTQYVIGADVTSEPFAGGPREQVRRYVLSYAAQGHAVALSQVLLDGWCSSGDPTENPNTGLLPVESGSAAPACGSGPQHNQWPPATTFSYSAAPLTPTFTTLPQTFHQVPPTPPAILDINSDGMPDLVDSVPSTSISSPSTTQTAWLNSPVPATATNTWVALPLTMKSPTLQATAPQMQPFAPSYTSGGFLNDGRVDAIWFDPRWAGNTLQSSANVAYATYSPVSLTSPSSFDWGTPLTATSSTILPEELQNCAPKTTEDAHGNGYPILACAWPWMYLGSDLPYGSMDIDGDGLQDLLVTSIYGASFQGTSAETYAGSNGLAVGQGASDYYPFLNVKFSTRNSDGVVVPFNSPAPAETASIISGGVLGGPCEPNAGNEGCASDWIISKSTVQTYQDLPNFCVGPLSPTCLNHLSGKPAPSSCGVVPPTVATAPHTINISNQGNTFGDVNGDGLPDWITLYSDHFTVSYGHGDGVFGVCPDGSTECGCGEAAPVSFSTAASNTQWGFAWSSLNQLDASLNAQFHDVDGDGFDDAIVPSPDGFDVYFIVTRTGTTPHIHVSVTGSSGFGWSVVNQPSYIGQSLPDGGGGLEGPFDSSYMFADMNASGVDDVLIENPSGQMGYVNVLGGERPGLLTGIQVTNGLSTTIQYMDLPALSRQAGVGLNKWTMQSPQSLHAVTNVLVSDETLGVLHPAPLVATQYTYQDPVFDGRDRQFLGFSAVEVVNVGDTSAPSLHTRTTFFQGYCNNASAPSTCAQSVDYPNHAIRGLPVVTETYGDQTANSDESVGAALSTVHRTFAEKIIYNGMDGRNVHHTNLQATDTYLYDNSAPVVRVKATQLVDVYSEAGGIFQSRFLLPGTFSQTHVAYVENDFWGMSVTENDYGEVDSSENSQDGIVSTVVTATPDNQDGTDNWIWRTYAVTLEGIASSTSPAGTPRTIAALYDSRGNLTVEQSPLSGSVAMARATTTELSDGGVSVPAGAATPPGASAGGLVTLAQFTMDPLGTGNVTRTQQPSTSRCQDITYDTVYLQLPTAKTVYTGGCGVRGLTTTLHNYARGLGEVTESSTPDGAYTEMTYDPFDRPLSVYRPDPVTPGGLETFAGVAFAYTDVSTTGPRTVQTTVNDGTSSHVSWTELDGYGRPLLIASPADTTAGDSAPWILSGQVSRNARGGIRSVYLPSFATTWNAAANLAPSGPARTLQHDPFGRVTAATDWDGTQAVQRVFFALGYSEQDANQIGSAGVVMGTTTVPKETAVAFDGHGRKIGVVAVGNGGEAITQLSYLPTGEPWVVSRYGYGADSSPSYQRWMQYDSLGRMVLNAEPATSTGFFMNAPAAPIPASPSLKAWTYAYNDAGQVVGTTDARGCGKNVAYDGAGRPQYEDYFGCTGDQLPYSAPNPATGAGAEVYYTYDTSGRPSDVYDRAARTHYAYDARSRLVSMQRNVVQPNVVPTPAGGYAPSTFEQDFAYDDLNRLVGQTTGEEPEVPYVGGASVPFGSTTSTNAIVLQYSQRGVLQSVGGSYGSLIKQAVYDADGLPHATTWGDLASTTTSYTYDSRRRLQELKTLRSAPGLWSSPQLPYTPPVASAPPTTQLLLVDDVFTRDAVGNPTIITDGRHASEWPQTAQPVTRNFGYDDFYRLTSASYAYAGAVNQYASPTPAETETEVPLPLQSATTRIGSETSVYDPLGNRTSSGDDTNAFFDRSLGAITVGSSGNSSTNQVIEATLGSGHVGAVYDASGNLVRLDVIRAGACESSVGCQQLFDYEWDEVGRLARARRYDFVPGETCILSAHECFPKPTPTSYGYPRLPTENPDADVSFTYDGGGARVLRASSAHAGTSANVTTTYTVDVFPSLRLADTTFGVESLADYDRSSSTDQVSLVAGGMALGRVVIAAGDPETSAEVTNAQHVFLDLADHLGSTTTVIDKATSELVERTTYSAYGRVESDYRPARWESFREAYKFTGKEDDVALGITYFGARYYSPYLGTWISPDPLAIHALASDPNPYAYVHGRSMRATDPFGLDCMEGQCPDPPNVAPPPPQWFANIFNKVASALSGLRFGGGGSSGPGSPANPGNTSSTGSFFNLWSQSANEVYLQSQAKFGATAGHGNPLTDGIIDATPWASAITSQIVMPMAGPAFSVTGEVEQTIAEANAIAGGGAAEGAEALAARAEQIHGALNPIAQEMRTTAVLDTSAGRIVAGGGVDLNGAQKALLQAGEMYNAAPGVHAEVTSILGARSIGARLEALGTTRDFCPACADYIEQSGGVITGPRTAVWPGAD